MDTETKALVVRQSNELVEASYKIGSLGEGRLIRLLIAQISPSDEDFKTYRIAAADFANFFGLTHKSVHEQIEKSARALREREILIRKGRSWFSTGWLSHAEYVQGGGYIEVSFHAKLKPYLLGLQGYFTKYELERVVNLRSGYAIRLFELLKQEEFKAHENGYFKRSFEYDELRELLGIDKKEYAFFKDFRVNVIQVAVKEINANNDFRITQMDYPRTGKKVSHVVFHCEKSKQLQFDTDGPPPKIEVIAPPISQHPDYISEMIAIGIDETTAYKWKRKYSVARLREAIAYTKAMQKAGKIRDSLTGFLARAITDNIGASWAHEKKAKEADKAKAEAEERKAREADEARAERDRKARAEAVTAFCSLPDPIRARMLDGMAEVATNAIARKAIEKARKEPEAVGAPILAKALRDALDAPFKLSELLSLPDSAKGYESFESADALLDSVRKG
jgi:flagellar biosynthesis GTPase FlhF